MISMADLLVRDLSEETVRTLKARARARNTSLQKHLKSVLERAAEQASVDPVGAARQIRARLVAKGIVFSDSGALQSEDRAR